MPRGQKMKSRHVMPTDIDTLRESFDFMAKRLHDEQEHLATQPLAVEGETPRRNPEFSAYIELNREARNTLWQIKLLTEGESSKPKAADTESPLLTMRQSFGKRAV